MEEKDLFGCYVTEEQGFAVKVFPISKQLRYSIPWYDVERVIDYLRGEATELENRIAVLGDDGEKFGVWPGTYEHCWEKGWVDRFFAALESNQSWLNTITLGEYVSRFPPSGRVYLPCASYEEMMEWSLPAETSWEYKNLKDKLQSEGRTDITRFMYSGLWRNFLVKYPEINRMQKKMLRIHQKVYEAFKYKKADCGLDELWQGQCNCPYWHGVFGGIYLADIRATNYSRLVEAEVKADSIIHKKRAKSKKKSRITPTDVRWGKIDFDDDGSEELLVDTTRFSMYFSPKEGGSIFEWDVRDHSFNILSTLARRPEAYHRALIEASSEQRTIKGEVPSIHDLIRIKDKDSLSHLVYDNYPRSSLIDHFFAPGTSLEQFDAKSYVELGDFVDQPYESEVRHKGNCFIVVLSRKGVVATKAGSQPFAVRKEISLLPDGKEVFVRYELKNMGEAAVQMIFGSEWNINMLGGGHNKQAYYRVPDRELGDSHLDSRGELIGIGQIILGNINLGFELLITVKPKSQVWRFPVESVSNSEGGVELIYQGSCLVFLLPVNLEPGTTAGLDLAMKPVTLES